MRPNLRNRLAAGHKAELPNRGDGGFLPGTLYGKGHYHYIASGNSGGWLSGSALKRVALAANGGCRLTREHDRYAPPICQTLTLQPGGRSKSIQAW